MSDYHTSVLLDEALNYLDIKPGQKYIDATLGGGGHTFQILALGGVVLGVDVDSEALDFVKKKLKSQHSNLKNKEPLLINGNFRNIKQIAEENGFGKVSGVLFDLGVSSHQFDAGERGFSFRKDAPLDMRMDASLEVTASDLINVLHEDELMQLFVKYGEEQFSRRIAKAIVEQRKYKRIETTRELAELIRKAYPKNIGMDSHFRENDTKDKKMIHPATKVFQALRIAVNDELHSLTEALVGALEILEKNGRIVVISFHSLEDRIVKHTFLNFESQKKGEIVTKKPIIPTDEEVEANKRSRSAKLRVFQKA